MYAFSSTHVTRQKQSNNQTIQKKKKQQKELQVMADGGPVQNPPQNLRAAGTDKLCLTPSLWNTPTKKSHIPMVVISFLGDCPLQNEAA